MRSSIVIVRRPIWATICLLIVATTFNFAQGLVKSMPLRSGSDTSIPYGITAADAAQGLELTFRAIVDSRCPADVNCMWAGDAVVDFLFVKNGAEATLELHTHSNYDTEASAHGYNVQLISVSPYPERHDNLPQDDEYVAVIRMTKQ